MDESDPVARRRRARERARWPGGLSSLDRQGETGPVDASPATRLSLVTELTLSAWALSGRPLPDYDRAHMPGRLIRADEDA